MSTPPTPFTEYGTLDLVYTYACVEVLCVTERPAVCVDADDSLLIAIRRLRQNHVHRVLVMDSNTGNALHVLTLRSILEFLASRVRTVL